VVWSPEAQSFGERQTCLQIGDCDKSLKTAPSRNPVHDSWGSEGSMEELVKLSLG
jgi:hypothetical protein